MYLIIQQSVIIPLLVVCICQFVKGHIEYMRYYRSK